MTQGVLHRQGGRHVPGHVYHWKHGWIPLTHFAALQKAHGSHAGAARYLSASKFVHGSHSPGEYQHGLIHKGEAAQQTHRRLKAQGLDIGSTVYWHNPGTGAQTRATIVGIEHTSHIIVQHSGNRNALIGHTTYSKTPFEGIPMTGRLLNAHVHTIPRENISPQSIDYGVDNNLDLTKASKARLLQEAEALKEMIAAVPAQRPIQRRMYEIRLRHVHDALFGTKSGVPSGYKPPAKPKVPTVAHPMPSGLKPLPETFTRLNPSDVHNPFANDANTHLSHQQRNMMRGKIKQAFALGPHRVYIQQPMTSEQTAAMLSDVKDVLHAAHPTLNGAPVNILVPTSDRMFGKNSGTMGYVIRGGHTIHLNPRVARGEYLNDNGALLNAAHNPPAAARTGIRKYVLTHELGHVVDNHKGGQSRTNSFVNRPSALPLGRYALGSHTEAYAEAFAQHQLGHANVTDGQFTNFGKANDVAEQFAAHYGWIKPTKVVAA